MKRTSSVARILEVQLVLNQTKQFQCTVNEKVTTRLKFFQGIDATFQKLKAI
jgi:hypothetical protein